jgi:hypothetical protein
VAEIAFQETVMYYKTGWTFLRVTSLFFAILYSVLMLFGIALFIAGNEVPSPGVLIGLGVSVIWLLDLRSRVKHGY